MEIMQELYISDEILVSASIPPSVKQHLVISSQLFGGQLASQDLEPVDLFIPQ